MTPENWKKILDFIRRTGDRAIIADPESDEIFVLTTLSDYEQKILRKSPVKGLTEDQLLDRINQDIAVWQSTKETEVDDYKVLEEEDVEEVEEDRYYVEPIE